MIGRCSVMGGSTPTSRGIRYEKEKKHNKTKQMNPPNTRTSLVCSKLDTSPTLA
jgi:hypothetical protein